MAERGARVILACRDTKRAEAACAEIIEKTGNNQVYVLQLDLASLKSVRAFAAEFLEREPRLDILINNAGVMGLSKTRSIDGNEMHMATNHFGHFLLTLLLLQRLKESKPSRIVNVSSVGHTFIHFSKDINCEESYNRFFAYLNSKLANVMFSKELEFNIRNSGVTVNSVHPGLVHTEMSRNLHSFVSILSV